jgi:hypothetical protein
VLGRRILVLMLVLLGLTALAASVAPRPQVAPRGGLARPSPSPVPTASPAPTAAPAGSTIVERTLRADPGNPPVRVRARVGDTVRLTVGAEQVVDTVRIDGFDKLDPVEPGAPATFELFAEEPGEHVILLLEADRRIGRLEIR